MSEQNSTQSTPDNHTQPQEKSPRKSRWKVTVGVIVAVVAIAGAGMMAWHEQPSFCGAICHYSMDAYLETFMEEAGMSGTDKYGNEVANTNAMMAVVHKAKDVTCLQCHVPSLGQQAEEGIETITGNYTVVSRTNGEGTALHEVPLDNLMANAGHGNDGDAFCLKSGCHDDTRETLTEKTADMAFNPHRWHHTEFECSDCHKSHRASVMVCTECHTDADESLPEGWVTYEESQSILESAAA